MFQTIRHYLTDNWWTLPLYMGACLLILSICFFFAPSFVEEIFSIVLLLVIVALVASWVFLIRDKRGKTVLLSVAMSIGVLVVTGPISMIGAMNGPDGFGRDHTIPEGIEYNIPLNNQQDRTYQNVLEEATVDSLDRNTYLQIWEGEFEGGIYQYDFYYTGLAKGVIFLRCYEITQNEPLSENMVDKKSNISECSKVPIEKSDEFKQYVKKKRFTIYEGDWGDYYAARIEVWHREAATGKETKLTEKIYRVQGWMR